MLTSSTDLVFALYNGMQRGGIENPMSVLGEKARNQLHVFMEKSQAKNTRLICAIDEMNTIEASNLHALTAFATAAGLYIIGSGQHHTNTALDYSYNVCDKPAGDGTRIKEVFLVARKLPVEDYEILQ